MERCNVIPWNYLPAGTESLLSWNDFGFMLSFIGISEINLKFQ